MPSVFTDSVSDADVDLAVEALADTEYDDAAPSDEASVTAGGENEPVFLTRTFDPAWIVSVPAPFAPAFSEYCPPTPPVMTIVRTSQKYVVFATGMSVMPVPNGTAIWK